MIALLLLWTPSFGLFDTLHHERLGSLSVGPEYGNETFEYLHDGTPISLLDAWEPFKIKEMFYMSITAVSSLMVSICLLSILASTLVLKFSLRETPSPGLFMQGLHCFIAPPLHIDWEIFYRRDKEKASVLNWWRRLDFVKYLNDERRFKIIPNFM